MQNKKNYTILLIAISVAALFPVICELPHVNDLENYMKENCNDNKNTECIQDLTLLYKNNNNTGFCPDFITDINSINLYEICYHFQYHPGGMAKPEYRIKIK